MVGDDSVSANRSEWDENLKWKFFSFMDIYKWTIFVDMRIFAFLVNGEGDVEFEEPIAFTLETPDFYNINSIVIDYVNIQIDSINGKLPPPSRRK